MKIYFLKDMTEDCVDAVIIAKTSTAKEVEDAICRAKENEDYTWDNILNELPSDCNIYDRWNGEIIWY